MKTALTSTRSVNRWLVLLAACAINFSLSGTSAFSIFVKPVMEATSWSMSAITLSYTLYNIVLCIVGIIVGTFSSKWKPWQIIYTGSVLFAAGWLITAFASSVYMMQIGFGIVAGAGGGFLYTYSVTNTLKWFPDKKGFVSGLLLGCAAIGPVFCSPLATAVLERTNVFSAFGVMGIIYASLLLLLGWLIRVPKAENTAQAANGTSDSRDYTWKAMLRTPTFYILYVLFACACTSYMMMLNAAAVIGQEQAGMTAAMAALSVSLLAVCNFAGRMLFGTLSDKIGRYQTLMIAMAINFAATMLMAITHTAVPFLILMCLVGACGGALLVMFPPITSERFGVRHSGLNYSIMFSAYSVAALIGPQIAAYYRNQANYGPAFIWAAGLTIAAFVLLLIISKQAKSKA